MHPTRRWLILSYFSHVDGMACAQHVDDRLPHLFRSGIEPILLTGPSGGRWLSGIHARVGCIAPSGLRFELRHLRRKHPLLRPFVSLATVLLLPFIVLEKIFIDLDSQWSWFPLAALHGVSLCRRQRPELIYSTGGPVSAHLAAAFISSITGIPFIAELQDPLIHEDWNRSRRAYRLYARIERFVCRRAAAVIFMTAAARDRAGLRTGLGERGCFIYPGANRPKAIDTQLNSTDFCRFSHFGSLGGSRNLRVALAALQLLLTERPDLRGVVRFDQYGTCDPISRSLLDRFPYPEVVCGHGRVSRQDALIGMRETDVLLLIQNTERFSEETIPSKTYEYLHAERPILGLVQGNRELEEMLGGAGHEAVPADDLASVKNAMSRQVEMWRSGGFVSRHSPYTVEAAVMALVEKVDGVMREIGCSDG